MLVLREPQITFWDLFLPAELQGLREELTKDEIALQTSGIKHCSLPRKGKLSQSRKIYQSQPWFKQLQKWRAGQEATISTLKRCYDSRRSRFRGSKGTKTWVGFSIFAYNLKRLALKI